jgi:CBS domain containing-hemolysin-like protein
VTQKKPPARFTPVAECEGLLQIEPLLLGRETDVLAALRQVAAHPATRIAGVIDDDGRLVGVLPILRLAEAVVARLAPEALLSTLSDIADIAAFSHSLEARTVGEAMLEPVSIAPSATIDDAFRRMHARHQSGIHVVDEAGRPIGYLDLLEVALVYADALARERGGEDSTV